MARFSVGGNGDGNRRIRRFSSQSSSWKKIRLSAHYDASSSSDSTSQPQLGGALRIEEELESDGEHEYGPTSPLPPDEESGREVELRAVALTPGPQQISTPDIGGRGVSKLGKPHRTSDARIVVTLEPDALECPICVEPLKSPVYQCDNGHIACELCCKGMMNKCGSCCLPIGYNRCRALEKIIESVMVQCPNMVHGCVETFKYSKKSNHEKACKYAPCSCPFPRCYHSGFYKDLYSHLEATHPSSYKKIHLDDTLDFSLDHGRNHVVFVEEDEGIVFILNRHLERNGMYAYVACIAPTASDEAFNYALAAKDTEDGCSISLCGVMENTPQWTEHHRPGKCLFVPDTFMNQEPVWELTIWS